MGNYAGVDWASEKHDVLVADAAGERLLSATFAHDELGLRSLCRALVRLEVELVAIERPDGLLVERLLDAGLRILPQHPNQVAATRDRLLVPFGVVKRDVCQVWVKRFRGGCVGALEGWGVSADAQAYFGARPGLATGGRRHDV